MGVSYLLLLLALGLALVAGVIVAGALRTRPVVPSGWAPTSEMTEATVEIVNGRAHAQLPAGTIPRFYRLRCTN